MKSQILVNIVTGNDLLPEGTWQHQAITWINVDLSSVVFCTIYVKAIVLQINKKVIITTESYIFKIKATSPKGRWVVSLGDAMWGWRDVLMTWKGGEGTRIVVPAVVTR